MAADTPVINAPPELREGLARRRLVASTGRCPCGTELVIPDRLEAGGASGAVVEHEDGCPATADAVVERAG